MEATKEYFAFISYQRQDEEWAKWLAHELEFYRLPTSLNGRNDIPRNLRPVFRDIDELSAGNLPQQIRKALANSKNLIVVCSPNSAKSIWVNKEIEDYIGMNKTDRVFPFIVEGRPFADNPEEECFPISLKNLPEHEERLGGNINEMGRDAAVVKIVAGMLNLEFDVLWQRYEREKAEEEKKIREQRDNLLRIQGRFIAEKANELVAQGDSYRAGRLITEVLSIPSKQDYPYIKEVESALKNILEHKSAIIRHHESAVNSVAFSPDGRLIASACHNKKKIYVWRADNGKLVQTIDFKSKINSIAFNCNAELIITLFHSSQRKANQRKTNLIYVWDIFQNTNTVLLRGGGFVKSVVRSPNSNEIAYLYGVSQKKGANEIRFFNLEEKKIRLLLQSVFPIRIIAYSPNGKLLASALGDNSIVIWDTNSGVACHSLKGHRMAVRELSFSPDAKTLLSVSGDNTIKIWDVNSGIELKNIENIIELEEVYINEDSPDLVSFSVGDTVRMWDLTNQAKMDRIRARINEKHNGIKFACFINEGQEIMIACGDYLRMLDINQGTERKTLNGHMNVINGVAYSPVSNLVATASDDATVRLWDVNGGQTPKTIERYLHSVNAASYSPDGKYILALDDDSLIILDSGCKQRISTIKIPHAKFLSAAYFPNGEYIASIMEDTSIFIIDAKSGQCIKRLQSDNIYGRYGSATLQMLSRESLYDSIDESDEVYKDVLKIEIKKQQICVSSNGDIAYVYGGNGIKIWNINKGTYYTLNGHNNVVNFANFSNDGNLLISASNDKRVIVWNIKKRVISRKLEGHTDFVNMAIFSPNNNYIASASKDNCIFLWDLNTGTVHLKLVGHNSNVKIINFNSEGNRLLSVSEDKTMIIWDTEDGTKLKAIHSNEDINFAQFRPDDMYILWGTPNAIHISPWREELSFQELADKIFEQFEDYPLTPAERHQYYLD